MNAPVRQQSGVVVPKPIAWHGRLAAWIIYIVIRIIAFTMRFDWRDSSTLFQGNEVKPVIFCIWHNRLALCMIIFTNYILKKQPSRHMAAIVSASKDGSMLARILELFHVEPVRGSSSRRGRQALWEMTQWAEKGYDLAVTPDGPRGPRYVLQNGVIALAQITGFPIVPVSYTLQWKTSLKSWDKFQIPIPFSRCEVILGEPVYVSRDASEADRETIRRQLEEYLQKITRD